MAGQEGKQVLAADVDAPKSPAPAPAGSDASEHLNLPLAANQDPDDTVPQVGSGDEEQEMLVRGKKNKDDASGSAASGSSAKKARAEDLIHRFPVAATFQAAGGVAPLGGPLVSSSPNVLPPVIAQLPFAAATSLRPPPRRPAGVPLVSPAAAPTFFGPITEEQDRISKLMEDDDFVRRAAISHTWRPEQEQGIFLPPNDAKRLKNCIKCNMNPATAASLPVDHICLCHVCYDECLANPLSTPCTHCFAAAFAQIKRG